MATVVNMHYSDYDVDIPRRSKWGNPFRIDKDGTRKEVCCKHMRWLMKWYKNKKEIKYGQLSNKWVIEHLHKLGSQKLGCVCFPLPCHGNNLVALINERILEMSAQKKIEQLKQRIKNITPDKHSNKNFDLLTLADLVVSILEDLNETIKTVKKPKGM